MSEYKKGQVLEKISIPSSGDATHAVVMSVGKDKCRLKSAKMVDGVAYFFSGAQTRDIPTSSIAKWYRPTDMTMY